MLVFPVFLKRMLGAAPLPLTQGALKQPNGGTRAPVTIDLVLTGGWQSLNQILAQSSSDPGTSRPKSRDIPAISSLKRSPKASHIKPVSRIFCISAFSCPQFPHFPRFPHSALWKLLRPLFFRGEGDRPHFPYFRRISFESLISKIRPTGFIMTGHR